MATLTERNVYVGVPNTTRGEASHISIDPTGNTDDITYASGRVAVVRSITQPLSARVFSLHTAPVTCARFSPDGLFIASGDESGIIRLWNPINLNQKSEMHIMAGPIRDIAFSPDGKFAVVGGESRGAFGKVIKIPSGGSAGICNGHTKRALAVDIIKGTVVTGSEDMTIGLFKGPPVREIDTPKFLRHHTGFINDIRFSPSGTKLAVASTDRTITIVDVETKELTCTISDHKASVTGLSWMDDDTLLSSSNDKTIRLWSISSANSDAKCESSCTKTIEFGSDVKDMQVGCVTSKKGDFVSVSLRPQINVIDAGSDEVSRVLRGHCKQIIGMSVVGEKIYSADYSGLMIAWDIDVGNSSLAFNGKGPQTAVCAIAANKDIVTNVGQDGKIFVTPTKSLTYPKPVTVKGGGVDIAVASDNSPDFSCIMVNETRLVAINTSGDDIATEMKFGNGETGCSVAVASDGSLIAVGVEVSGGAGELRFYTFNGSSFAQAGDKITLLSAPNRMAFSPDNECIAVGEKSRKVKFYNPTTKSSITGGGVIHTARVDAICFSSDGTYVASGGMDGSVAVWPVNSEEEPIRLKTAHRNGVTGIGFTSANCVMTSGGDSCLRTWNL